MRESAFNGVKLHFKQVVVKLYTQRHDKNQCVDHFLSWYLSAVLPILTEKQTFGSLSGVI